MAPAADPHPPSCNPPSLMIESREEARAKLKRKEHRLEAAAWLATRDGFTSREAILCSVASLSDLVQSTLPDGSQTFNHLIHDSWLASAVAIYLPLCGAPVFASTEAQLAYHTELERALRAGLTPVPAREAALQAVGYETPHRPDDVDAG